MRRHGQTSKAPSLFDLPLVVDPNIAKEADRNVKHRARPEKPKPTVEAEQIDLPTVATASGADERRQTALVRRRFQAGILDAAASALALVLLIAASSQLGAKPTVAVLPAYLAVILEFSFFYVVFSVAFWGRTPGMARARLVVGNPGGGAATLRQAVLRWLGGVLTVSLLGLPALLALREGRSLSDYLSRVRLESTLDGPTGL